LCQNLSHRQSVKGETKKYLVRFQRVANSFDNRIISFRKAQLKRGERVLTSGLMEIPINAV